MEKSKNLKIGILIVSVCLVIVSVFATGCSSNKESEKANIHNTDYKYALGNTRLNLHDCDLDYTPQFHAYLDNHTFDMLDVDFRKTKDDV